MRLVGRNLIGAGVRVRLQRRCFGRSFGHLLLVSVCALVTAAALLPGAVRAASTPNTALINGDSVTTADGITNSGNPISLEQYAAQRAGFKVTVVTGTQWDAMTKTQFAHYALLISGDPLCSSTPSSTTSNASTWAPVVMGTAGGNTRAGNRTLIGTDPEFHYLNGGGGAGPTTPGDPSTAGAEHLVQAGIQFAGDGPKGTTGMYFDTSCDDNGQVLATLDMLTKTGTGHWSEDSSPPCGGSVQLIAKVAAFSGVSDSDIQGWQCSDHITFPKFPADWNAQAVATDTASHPTCGTDPGTGTTACGESYVLLAGRGIIVTAPNLSLSPKSAKDPVGGSHTVTATVSRSGKPASGAKVTFVIASGPNAGVSGKCTLSTGTADPSCKTGSDGKVRFTYHDSGGAGTDTVNASVTLSGTTEHATATKTWIAGPSITLKAYAGYADTFRRGAPSAPSPWKGGADVIFEGCNYFHPARCHTYDAGAIRLVNTGSRTLTVSNASVTIGSCTFSPWPGLDVKVPGGHQLILTQTGGKAPCGLDGGKGGFNFDTSETSQSCSKDDGLIPVVHVTVGGRALTYRDGKQILNTGGVNPGAAKCGKHNETHDWGPMRLKKT